MKPARKKTNKKQSFQSRTKVVGRVHVNYVQWNVPVTQVEATVEALSHALLTDFYRRYNPVTDNY